MLIWKIVNLSRLYIPQYPDLFDIADNWDDVQPLALGVDSVQASNKMFQEYFECLRKAQHGLSLKYLVQIRWRKFGELPGWSVREWDGNFLTSFWQFENLVFVSNFRRLQNSCLSSSAMVSSWESSYNFLQRISFKLIISYLLLIKIYPEGAKLVILLW